MKMAKLMIIYTAKAKQNLRSITDYISRDNSIEVADKQKEKIKLSIANLATMPKIGQEIIKGYRKLSVKPFIVIYKIEKETVEIIRVLDGRQDWQKILLSNK